MELLDQMLAYQEPAHDELRAGADESSNVWLVSLVQWYCYWCSHRFLPRSFEILPPLREFTKAANLVQHDLKLSVIRRRELRNQDPRE